MMHYQRTPIQPNYQRPSEYEPDYHPPYNPGMPQYSPPEPIHEFYSRTYHPRLHERAAAPPFHSKYRPTAPPFHYFYDNYNNQIQQPEVRRSLKKRKVKSIGTQSKRKISILSKLKLKIQPSMKPDNYYNQKNTCSTQTEVEASKHAPTKSLFTWKNLQALAIKLDDTNIAENSLKSTLEAQREIASGGRRIRNVMMNKMFKKKNPFAPRNLLLRITTTLLGRAGGQSSFGDPPALYRPKMFL